MHKCRLRQDAGCDPCQTGASTPQIHGLIVARALSTIDDLVSSGYQYGFVTKIESDTIPASLNKATIHTISTKKGEPKWLLESRLKAYRHWLSMAEAEWAHLHHPPIDFQSISYYSAPGSKADAPRSLAEVDPELLETYRKLGIILEGAVG